MIIETLKLIIKILKKIKNFYLNIFQSLSSKVFGSKLGGNLGRTNIDYETLSYLIDNLKISSFLDIGCGKGGMVFAAIERGLYARGIEGDIDSIPVDCPLIFNVDYRNSNLNLKNKFDIGWSIEFLEHIPENSLQNVFKDFQNCKYLLITAAPPGWGGDGHVNEQREEYWLNKFKEFGFILDIKITKKIRETSTIYFGGTERKARKQFIRNRGLFFINKKFDS